MSVSSSRRSDSEGEHASYLVRVLYKRDRVSTVRAYVVSLGVTGSHSPLSYVRSSIWLVIHSCLFRELWRGVDHEGFVLVGGGTGAHS